MDSWWLGRTRGSKSEYPNPAWALWVYAANELLWFFLTLTCDMGMMTSTLGCYLGGMECAVAPSKPPHVLGSALIVLDRCQAAQVPIYNGFPKDWAGGVTSPLPALKCICCFLMVLSVFKGRNSIDLFPLEVLLRIDLASLDVAGLLMSPPSRLWLEMILLQGKRPDRSDILQSGLAPPGLSSQGADA